MLTEKLMKLKAGTKVYLIMDDQIKMLKTPSDVAETGKVFDPKTDDWWSADYLEVDAAVAVAKFLDYQKVKELEAEMINELGRAQARQIVIDSEHAGAIADPEIAIKMFTRALNRPTFN